MAVRAKKDMRESKYPERIDKAASNATRVKYFFIKEKFMVKNTLITITNKQHKTITLRTLKTMMAS